MYWGGDFDAVVNLIKNETIDPNKIRFYIGYSGWGEGQLANEMTEKTWLTVKATRKLICLLYTSDAADERSSVDLGGRSIIKKKNT